MVLFLIGYMGSGKSLIGKKLARLLHYDYLDFDDYIEKQEQSTIVDLFKTKGEIYFRKAEYKYLKDLLNLDNTVVALGGGTPCYGNNMTTLMESNNTKVIYLKGSIPTLSERLFDEREKRPLISHITSKNELNEFIGKHLFERAPIYEKANFSVSTNNRSVEAIVEDILMKLY